MDFILGSVTKQQGQARQVLPGNDDAFDKEEDEERDDEDEAGWQRLGEGRINMLLLLVMRNVYVHCACTTVFVDVQVLPAVRWLVCFPFVRYIRLFRMLPSGLWQLLPVSPSRR